MSENKVFIEGKEVKFEDLGAAVLYSSPETTPPPGIKWSDGHVCTPEPVKK